MLTVCVCVPCMEYREAPFQADVCRLPAGFFLYNYICRVEKKGPLAPEGGKTIPKGRVARDFMSFGLSFLSVKFLQ